MSTGTITVEVDEESAKAFTQASEKERRKLEVLLRLRLRELTTRRTRPLSEIMDEMGRTAEERGLTPEILESLLRDE
jgi:hypothetical protein